MNGFGTRQAIYEQLGLKVTYLPGQDKLRADVTIGPEEFLEHVEKSGAMGRVRGGIAPKTQCMLPGEFAVGGAAVSGGWRPGSESAAPAMNSGVNRWTHRQTVT